MEGSIPQGKAIWDPETVDLFCDLCIRMHDKRNRHFQEIEDNLDVFAYEEHQLEDNVEEDEASLSQEMVEVSMATKMANVEKAEELLEKLCSASWDAAVQGGVFNIYEHDI
ncbi:hypothetical protein L484_022415 [Morus notabilis]|uniref:Uncharacterized protein n=1 Tax=Morus notabilis TaxID=981085 RepID=W9R3J6_9ROSA|nr:hypothetical protein L484_022415 [Morus notabilis]